MNIKYLHNSNIVNTTRLLDVQIETDEGWKPIEYFHDTGLNKIYNIKTETNKILTCSSGHRLIDRYNREVTPDLGLSGTYIKTIDGDEKIIYSKKYPWAEPLCDLTVDSNKHLYYTNGILSHNCVLADEFAHVAPNIVDKFYNNLFPVITAGKARFMITSTQNGYNLFYRLYTSAVQGDSEYAPFKVDWYDVPEWNPVTQKWEKRDENWHRLQVANLGGEENFNKQFGTSFDISAPTLISQKKMRIYQKDLTEFECKEMPGILFENYWYWDPMVNIEDLNKYYHIITCDLSEGLGQDYTIFSIYRLINDDKISYKLKCIGYFKANDIPRDGCALALCMLQCRLLDQNKLLISIEKNTYGDLFIATLRTLAEQPNYTHWDPACLVKYYNEGGTKWNWGIKLTAGNKTDHCILFKEDFERGFIENKSTTFAGELINFCNDGTNHFKASFGHDDMIMTAVQLEFVKETNQYKMMVEDFFQGNTPMTDNIYNPYDDLGNPNMNYQQIKSIYDDPYIYQNPYKKGEIKRLQ